MAYQVLARKWRPKRFQDVIGQEHITKSIQNAVLSERVGHAYLLCGTRGIGKTTVARILAKSLRCERLLDDGNPCGECHSCLDYDSDTSMNVIEIDGASNNGVDHIRDLISNIQYLPTTGSKKIYIIDEVHMVTTNAFNALLKTLEEPPTHVVFIFATTEPGKLLGTVLSRCQRFDFKIAAVNDLVNHVKKISQTEKIHFDSDGLIKQICIQGNGSVRDTLSILDQVLSYSTDYRITEEIVSSALGVAGASSLKSLVSSILKCDAKSVSKVYREMIQENVNPKNIMDSVLDTFFELIEKIDDPAKLYSDDIIEPDIIEDISMEEMFWLYEVLAKDMDWSLSSISPGQVNEIVLQKLAHRRTFLMNSENNSLKKKEQNLIINELDNSPIDSKEIENTVERSPALSPESKKELSIACKTKSWDDFLRFLQTTSPASAANLEQGNLVEPLIKDSENIMNISLGFGPSEAVFYEYLKEVDVQKKLKLNMVDFFEMDQEAIKLSLILLDNKQKEEKQFRSKMEIKIEGQEIAEETKKNELLADERIKEAEKLFNTKIDKIVINKT